MTDAVNQLGPNPPALPLLTVENVRAQYDDQVALHGVSMAIPAGACTAVLGSNGAGKTTLMNAIVGVHRPIQGRVVLDGRDVSRLPANRIVRLGVGYVPEGRGVFPELTVGENLRLAIGRDPALHQTVFDQFPVLHRFSNRLAGTLSGGEQQMLSIAPALVNDYRVLLIDELSLGLAPIIVEQLFGVLERIRERGVAIVLVEQFAQRALEMADSVYVLRKGRVVLHAAARDLRGDPERLHHLYMGG